MNDVEQACNLSHSEAQWKYDINTNGISMQSNLIWLKVVQNSLEKYVCYY